VGFDSRESLGEKETGARAALPIWMTFMRAAVAGKPDEQFPGDDEGTNLLKAQATPPANAQPARLASTKPVQPSVTGNPANVTQSPAAATSPAKVVIQPGVKPVARLTEATDAAPRVKPALTAAPMTANPRGIVRPAAESNR
jgi:penicillin-binding protein 1A